MAGERTRVLLKAYLLEVWELAHTHLLRTQGAVGNMNYERTEHGMLVAHSKF